jgi:hypothetical protein
MSVAGRRLSCPFLSAEVRLDRICAENGIRHLLTAPRSLARAVGQHQYARGAHAHTYARGSASGSA